MSTNSSILDDFLIDTTRLSLIRRYRPPFELDKLVLSADKRSSMLELMRQQRDAAKEAAAQPQTAASTDDKMDVEPPAPTAIAPVSDDSKMDVDEPNTSLKEENASESNHTDSDADQRSQLKRKQSDLEEEKKQKLIRLAELDKKVKEAQSKIDGLEEEKGGLFVQLKQVLAVESKSRQEEQRLMQQRAEEARLALLAQQQQLQQQQSPLLPIPTQPPPSIVLPGGPVESQVASPFSPYAPSTQSQTQQPQYSPYPPSASVSPAPRPRSPERSFTSPGRGGYERDFKREDESKFDRGSDRYPSERGGDKDRDRDNYSRGGGRERFNDRDRERFGGSGGYAGGNRFQGGFNNNDRDRFEYKDNSRDNRGGFSGPKRDFRDNRDHDRDRERPVERERFNDRDRDFDRDRDRDRDWNRRYERDGYNSRPLSSPPPVSYPPPPPRQVQPMQPPPPAVPSAYEHQMPPPMYPPHYAMPPPPQYPPYGVPQEYANPAFR